MTRNRVPRSRLRLALLIAILGCVVGLVLNWRIIAELDRTRTEVTDRAAAARLDAEHLAGAFNSRVANGRGYMLTGDPAFLQARGVARAEFLTALEQIRTEHASLMAQLAPIDKLLPRMIAASDEAVALRERDPAAAIAFWERRVNPLHMEALAIIRSTIAAAEGEQARAHDTVEAAGERVRVMLAVRALAAVAALALLLVLIWRSHKEQIRGALQDQQHELLQILEHVPVGVFVRAVDGTPYYQNRTARELLGTHGVEHLYEAGTDQRYPRDRLPITRALTGEEIEVSDMELRRDGDTIPLHVRGGTVRAPDGEIAYAVAAFQDVRALHRHAMRDSLTGLANRASVHQTFRRDRQVADRGGRPLSVGLIDLDHFKSINDKHGHAMGDRVLQASAGAIVESLRAVDVVARWGGEELVVILPDTDLAGARRAIDKALVAVRSMTFLDGAHEPFEVTFSAGVATARPGENLDSIVSRADAALYKAKRAGRCRVFDETVVAIATNVLAAVPAPLN